MFIEDEVSDDLFELVHVGFNVRKNTSLGIKGCLEAYSSSENTT